MPSEGRTVIESSIHGSSKIKPFFIGERGGCSKKNYYRKITNCNVMLYGLLRVQWEFDFSLAPKLNVPWVHLGNIFVPDPFGRFTICVCYLNLQENIIKKISTFSWSGTLSTFFIVDTFVQKKITKTWKGKNIFPHCT